MEKERRASCCWAGGGMGWVQGGGTVGTAKDNTGAMGCSGLLGGVLIVCILSGDGPGADS